MTIHAFPSGHNPKTGMYEHGMTLRDYFAAKAMQALIGEEYPLTSEATPEEFIKSAIVTLSYEYADAMMKERDE